jgi:hypothetical protein
VTLSSGPNPYTVGIPVDFPPSSTWPRPLGSYWFRPVTSFSKMVAQCWPL